MIAIFAHWGVPAAGYAVREDTVEAFTAARNAGADGIEPGLRTAAQDHLVVHHDACLPGVGRITNIEAGGSRGP